MVAPDARALIKSNYLLAPWENRTLDRNGIEQYATTDLGSWELSVCDQLEDRTCT